MEKKIITPEEAEFLDKTAIGITVARENQGLHEDPGQAYDQAEALLAFRKSRYIIATIEQQNEHNIKQAAERFKKESFEVGKPNPFDKNTYNWFLYNIEDLNRAGLDYDKEFNALADSYWEVDNESLGDFRAETRDRAKELFNKVNNL